MFNCLSRMLSALDRWQDRSRLLGCVEALGDRLPQLHMPRSSRAAAQWLDRLCRLVAAWVDVAEDLGSAVGRAITWITPTDEGVARAAAWLAEGWAAALDRRMPLMAARVRQKNGLVAMPCGAGG